MKNQVLTAKVREALRDLALTFVAAAVAVFVAAGSPLSWAILPALGYAGITAVVAQVVLWLTPLTQRYGVTLKKNRNALTEEHLEKVPV
jgi:hypothetical protein